MHFTLTKLTLTLTVIIAIIFGYFIYSAIGDTTIGVTLKTNPTLEDGLVGHWTFDGKDMFQNVADSSGYGSHGSLNGQTSTTTAPGVMGQALNFDGVNDYVNLGNPAGLDLNTSAVTLSMWVKFDNSGGATSQYFISKQENAGQTQYGLRKNSGSNLRFITITTDGAVYYSVNTNPTFNNTDWFHIVGVYNGVDMRIYVNTTLQTSPASQTGTLVSNGKDLLLGAHSLTPALLFDGKLDDARVYDRALSAEEVKRLYQLGATTKINKIITTNPDLESGLVGHWTFDGKDMYNNVADRSGQGNHGALQGQTSTTTAPGVMGQALSFDGVDDYVDMPSDYSSLDIPTTLSQFLWIKTNSLSRNQHLFDKYDTTGSNREYFFRITNQVLTLFWGDPVDGSFEGRTDTASNVITETNTYYHVGWTYNAGTVVFYVDGVAVPQTQVSGVIPTSLYNGSETLNIGTDNQSQVAFVHGIIDDARIYNRTLSADEIKRLYDLGR